MTGLALRVRRSLVRFAVVAASVAASAGVVGPRASQPADAAPRRANILIIVTDDQPIGTLAVMPKTRRIFRRGGTEFTNGYVTTPLCCPSRATILTGRYAHNHGVRTQEPQQFDARSSFPRYLARAGYQNAIVGKYLNRWGSSPGYLPPSPPYFDKWATTRPNPPSGFYDTVFNVNGSYRTIERYSTGYIRDKAVQFVRAFEKSDSRPWMLYVAPVAPHLPAIPAPVYRGAPLPPWRGNPSVFESDKSDKPPFVRAAQATFSSGRWVRARQLRSLMSVDDLIGDLFRELGRLGEGRTTLAIFISDNGFLWADHGLVNKTVPYTRSIRLPLLMRWPGRVPAGVRDPRFAANVDIAPTVLHAAGVGPDRPMDGKSLLRSWRRRHMFVEYFRGDTAEAPTWGSVRTGRAQYVEYYDDGGSVVFREYYDLQEDPWQLTNLLGDLEATNDPSPIELAELSERIRAGSTCSGATCP
ncbi:MAG: sulfatase [Actinomycetota bacterium]|nr:sulfatase [Actinomycetota bacterium]